MVARPPSGLRMLTSSDVQGSSDAVEKENELLRKQWLEGDIESVARAFRTSHSTGPRCGRRRSQSLLSAVGKPRSILKTSDVKVMKCFANGSMALGDGEPWEKGHT